MDKNELKMKIAEIEAALEAEFREDKYQKIQVVDYYECKNKDKQTAFVEIVVYLLDDYDCSEIGIVSFYRDCGEKEYEISGVAGNIDGRTIRALKKFIEEE
jgi:hypothetical protein